MSSTNLAGCGSGSAVLPVCFANSFFHLAFAQSFGCRFLCSWGSLISACCFPAPAAWALGWAVFSSCWSFRLVGWAPAWIHPFHSEGSLWWNPSRQSCRRCSCVPSRPGNWKQHTQSTCLDSPSTNQSRKLCLDIALAWKGTKAWSHNFPKQIIIQTWCYCSEGAGGAAGIVLFSPPHGSHSVRHKAPAWRCLSQQCPPPRDTPAKGQLWNRSVLKSEKQMKMWQPVDFWVCCEVKSWFSFFKTISQFPFFCSITLPMWAVGCLFW